MIASGYPSTIQPVIAAMTNTYASYLTTYEEYQVTTYYYSSYYYRTYISNFLCDSPNNEWFIYRPIYLYMHECAGPAI